MSSTKPTGLPKLIVPKVKSVNSTFQAKSLIPSDRLKPANQNNRLPLTQNLANFKRAKSPDISKIGNRVKLRRSVSAFDLRETQKAINLKRTQPVLAPIPAKSTKFTTLTQKTVATKANSNFRPNTTSSNTATQIKKQCSPSSKNGTGANIRKKIPAYDYKARFLDLQERHKILKDKFDEAKEQLANLEQFEECQAQLITLQQELKDTNIQFECLQKQNNVQAKKNASLTKCLENTQEELSKLKKEHEIVVKERNEILKELEQLKEEVSVVKEQNVYFTKELDECKEQLFKVNIERRELHNAVLDLRGNIRVFCRVRPPLNFENDRQLCGWNYLDEVSLEIQSLENGGGKAKIAHPFTFDQVFHPKSTQEDIFEMVSPLIQSALDGYNICIFAYGQTGSGKTFTMDGVENNIGVIPRTVDLIFDSIKNYKRLGWTYEIKASFLEIYNENLYDLLSNEQKLMEIRMLKTNSNDIYVSNITQIIVQSAEQLRELINIAKMNRATASTIGNERSSRSHAVTRIELIGTHIEKNELSIGMINLVDLAGSESPKTSIRMNETKNINRSLSELTNVILALLQKQEHVPYRNSKLTHLLMPSLGGNSKTLMFINVSPFQDCFAESVKSLRFASTVNSCKMAKARKNRVLNLSNSSSNISNTSSSFN